VVANGRRVLSNVISSQIDLHKKYGGVVPEIASRKHVELIVPVINQAIEDAGIKREEIDAVGVTYGPGLVGALLVGLSAAKALAFALGKPLIGVHHIEGHIAANYIEHQELEPPFICLVASGGHSHIVHVVDYDRFEIIGQTRDDAAGEAFDKIARAVGLGYPGGPAIDKAAKLGSTTAVKFPRVKFSDGSLDFSNEILESLDVVVASIHTNFHLDREKQTERIIRAIKDENVDIIGHLSGRLLNRRPAYELDFDRILEEAAKNQVILEINSHPDRLDIDAALARRARQYGIKISINSDAHHKNDLKLVKYGVLNARRGWLGRQDVVNTLNREELTRYIKE
jgi:glycoprotease/Kae1 family metallohydrolase